MTWLPLLDIAAGPEPSRFAPLLVLILLAIIVVVVLIVVLRKIRGH